MTVTPSAPSTAPAAVDIAAATRMLVAAGILGYSGHLSVRRPDGRSLWIQPVNDPRAELAPERVLSVDFDGTVLDGAGKPPSELPIHVELYRARPDVGAVAHFHHDPTTVFSVVEGRPIVAVTNHASRWAGGVPVHTDLTKITSAEQGRALAATVGSANAALLRAHGEVVVAEDARGLFVDVVHFVENAAALAAAITLGPLVPLSGEEAGRFEGVFDRTHHIDKLWAYYTSVAVAQGTIPARWYPSR